MKPTTDPFWTGGPYDYANYAPWIFKHFGVGIAFGLMRHPNSVNTSAFTSAFNSGQFG